jgi:membrane dipeptidase
MTKPFLTVDAHEDLAWNMLTFGRDYTQNNAAIRASERDTETPTHNGDTLLGWDVYQRGKVALVFATLFSAPLRKKEGDWDTQCYRDVKEAHTLYQNQLDAYHRLTDDHPDKFRLVTSQGELANHLTEWENAPDWPEPVSEEEASQMGSPAEDENRPPVGLVVLMEGAEGVRDINELPEWWAGGVRLIGPAWAGNRFCGGTHEPGPLTDEGRLLLEGMADTGFVLDISHMDIPAALESLDRYESTVIASHANPLAMMPGSDSNRFLPDEVIEGLIERGGVIGIVPFNLFLDPNWTTGMRRELVSVEIVAAHIDYICQIAGDARHVGIGSDFDGGFGWQSIPHEMNTAADLHMLAPLLADKGYSDEDLSGIFGQNWLGVIQSALPEAA